MMHVFGRLSGLLSNRSFASAGAVSLLSTAIVVAAVQSEGSTATNVRLDDGSVWVTNLDAGRVGRLNIRINELDFAVRASTTGDVLQETVPTAQREPERTVLFVPAEGGVARLDVLTNSVTGGDNEIPFADYRVGGGVAAVLAPDTGRLWVGSSQQVIAPDYPDDPDALIEPGSRLVVTQAPTMTDETGADRTFGRVLIIDSGGWYEVELDESLEPVREEPVDRIAVDSTTTTTTVAGEFSEAEPAPLKAPERTPLGVPTGRIAEVTAVGSEPVVLLDDGTVVLSDGATASVPGEGHRLQQVGAEWSTVLVASDSGLYEVDLASAEVERLVIADASAAAPVRVGGCARGAWSGDSPKWFRACGDETTGLVDIPEATAGAELVWRVNQNNVALNSTGNGDVWADKDGTLTRVGNWSDLEADSEDSDELQDATGESEVTVDKTCDEGGADAPTANPDQLGLRPRQSIIDVLSNDDDLNCEPIAIVSVGPPAGDWGQLTIIGNGQHLLYSPSDSMLQSAGDSIQTFQFSYVVADIAGHRSKPAQVTVAVKDLGLGNVAPALRPKGDDGTRLMRTQVEDGASISYNVLPDWWDPDGDDLRLVAAVPESNGQVAATPDGLVRFSAFGTPPGVYQVAISMSDGQATATEMLEVTVKPKGSVIAPATSNDFITIVKGATRTISPLDNDSDGNEDQLSLRPLWTTVDEPGYTARLRENAVEITANRAGVYALEYEASDGIEATKGTIRLEVVEPGENNSGPIAVPDQVKLRPNRVVNVDVLANDVDADGDMLAVVDVDVASSDPAFGVVRATLVDRRMVQVEVAPGPTGEDPTGPFTVTYVVSDARESDRASSLTSDEAVAASLRSRGAVSVLVQPPGQDQPPVLTNDTAVVRSGDVVAVPVLLNDIDPDSDAISLVGVNAEQAATLEVSGNGVAWVQGREVFFQGGAPGRHEIFYDVEAGGRGASAELSVVVKALPDPVTNPNQPPEPPDLELRAIRGGTVRVRIPSFGIDPDGDSVVLVGSGAPGEPTNRVLMDDENPGTLLFTAGRRSAATDSFTYTVRDRFGERATATVDVMVLDDEGWAPQAFDDVFSGRPGRTLTIPVVANDTSPQDRRLEIAEMPFFDAIGQPTVAPENTGFVRLLDQNDPDTRGLIEVDVPTDATVLVEHYRISDGLNPSSAFIRVTPDENAPNLPPVALPDEVSVEEVRGLTEATVDVVANDYDPDTDGSPLRLELPANQNASIAGSRLVVPLLDTAQIVLYRVIDNEGAEAVGVVRVPGLENSPPRLSAIGEDPEQRVIDAATGGPMTILLDVVTEDPDGDAVLLTDTEVVLNGVGEIRKLGDGTGFVYTPPKSLTTTETVTITFEVTDRSELSKAERQLPNCNCVKELSVQVIVVASSPPTVVAQGAVQVPVYDEPVTYDLAPLTFDEQGDELTYRLDPTTFGVLDVEQNGSVLTIVSRQKGDQQPPVGTRIRIDYTVTDSVFPAVANSVVVTIVATNRGRPAAASFSPIEAKRDELISTPNFVDAAFNPFEGDALTLVNATVTGSARVNCAETGVCEFFSDTVGTFTITYTLRDVAGQTTVGTFEVLVKGKPFAPGIPKIESVGDKVVNLSWAAADMQGGEFVSYHVTAVEAGITKQFSSTAGSFDGLLNATSYTFTVAAENELGLGEVSSPSSVAIPDRVPDPPEDLTFIDYADQSLTVDWSPPSTAGDFSAIIAYEVRIGGQVIRVDGGVTSVRIGLGGQGDPLANGTDYSFEMRAQNSATTDNGWGAWSSRSAGTERPSRYPDPPTGVFGVNNGDGGTPAIKVTWTAPANDGGRPLTQYRVCREQDGDCQTVDASVTQATFPAVRASEPTFTVVAINTDKNRPDSDPSAPSDPVIAIGDPDAPVFNSTVVSSDKKLVATATSTNGSGCSDVDIEYRIASFNGGAWQSTGEFTPLTNGTRYTIEARAVLPSTCPGAEGEIYESSVTSTGPHIPYGDLVKPTMDVQVNGTEMRIVMTSNRGDDARPTWKWSLSVTARGCSGSGSTNTFTSAWEDAGYSFRGTCTVTVSADGVPSEDDYDEATTAPPPPPRVWTTKGELYGPCDSNSSATCYYFAVNVENFPAGSFGITCFLGDSYERSGGTITVGSTGSASKSASCVASSGGVASVTVNGVTGNGVGYW